MPEKITIFVDHREIPSVCFQLLSQNSLVDLQVKTLPIGDYEVGHFIFERKALYDLAGSLIDGRLFTQMGRLLSKKRPVFLIEGLPEKIGNYGVLRASLQGALITLTLIYGIPVLYALDPQETELLILYTAQQQSLFRRGPVARSGYVPKKRVKRQLYVLQGLPGIGVKRTGQLLAVRAVIQASIEELQEVEGVGKQTAKLIHEILS